THHRENAIVRAAKRAYLPSLRWALAHRGAVIGLAVATFAGSMLLVPKLGSEFLPELNEGTIWVNATLPPGISIGETTRWCRRMRELLHQTPEVSTVVSKAGRPEDGTDPKPINMIEIFVGLKPESQWRPGFTKDKLLDEMDRNLDALPGVETSFSQPIRDNVLESISQIDGQVVVKVFGDDVEKLHARADAILKSVGGW